MLRCSSPFLLLGLLALAFGACEAKTEPTEDLPPADTAGGGRDAADTADSADSDLETQADEGPDLPVEIADTDATEPPPALAPVAGDPNFATAASGWYRGDLHYHTNYSGDAQKQGGDDLPVALAIADAFRDPAYLAAFPGRAGNGLDYIAITDHRTDAAILGPTCSTSASSCSSAAMRASSDP